MRSRLRDLETNTDGIDSRPKRIPVSQSRDVLAVKNIPNGKIARWVNDVEDRVLRFRQGGWEFVTDKGIVVGEKTVESSHDSTGSVVSRLVGTDKFGKPLIAYLMVIDRDWYNEDQETKLNSVEEGEAAIYEKLNQFRRRGEQPVRTEVEFEK